MTATLTKPEQRPYRAIGAALALWSDRDPEILLCGPAGTGKSRACLEKVWACANQFPGCRILLCRKTRSSLTETALVTFEDKVVPANHPVLQGAHRMTRQSYVLENGSEIIVRGLDDMNKIMSGEYDLIYVQEAIEATEDDIEKLTTRLRNGVVPFQQLIMDTNPDAPYHWLKQRCEKHLTRLYDSRLEDNPVLYESGQWTESGRKYLEKLDRLTGARLQRLRYGKWVQAEGIVYEEWDTAVHLIDRNDPAHGLQNGIPKEWRRFRAIDFGYVNPFVCQWWAMNPDGILYRYREIYHTKRLVEDHARQITELSKEEKIELTVCDHDREDRETLLRHGVASVAAKKEIEAGIQSVEERLKDAGNGKRRIYLLRDSLVERDPELIEAKLPYCTEQEFDVYIRPPMVPGKPQKELPVDMNNHGMDSLRYMVMQFAAGGWAHDKTLLSKLMNR